MNEPARFTDRFREVSRKRDDVVIGRLFNFIDPSDRELRARFDLFESVARNRAPLGVDFANRDLHVQPFLKLVLL